MFYPNGTLFKSEFLINFQQTIGDQVTPEPAPLLDGSSGFAIVWSSTPIGGGHTVIMFQQYDMNGNSIDGQIVVNPSPAANSKNPRIIALDTEILMITWNENNNQILSAVVYNNGTTKVQPTVVINAGTSPCIAKIKPRHVVVGYTSINDSDILAVIIDFSLTVVAQINVSVSNGSESGSQVALLTNGTFMFTWAENEGSGNNVMARSFFVDTYLPVTDEFQVNGDTVGSDKNAAIACNTEGYVAVVWEASGTIWAKIYSST